MTNASLLWEKRLFLGYVGACALLVSAIIAFAMPKDYESTARIMPPDQASSGAAMLAAIAGHSLGSLGSLAGSLLGSKTSSALFIDLLHSRTIGDHLIDRFDLQRIYHKHYRIDTIKYLAHRTVITEDKKSGIISITFTDTDRQRAHDVTQAYLEELNSKITHSNTSSARREREFIEKRLISVQTDLLDAEKALSQFSSVNTTLDIKEQTHAMVDAAAKLQAELIVAQSEVESLKEVYGDQNIRVRAAQARIAGLQRELSKMSGSSDPLIETSEGSPVNSNIYPSIRQLPRLAVPYANLYRRVRIQETVFELLSQQYEMSRIEEAKDTPVVSIVDPPLVAEKKSFPPRLLVIVVFTLFSILAASVLVIALHLWTRMSSIDPRKVLIRRIAMDMRVWVRGLFTLRGPL
ncbi:GumC family protein [Granulicella arctica]|uniref:GumC family protein n=1 Tax=Granulicella arctica TaxID=940613 RepID=UPI0021E0EC5A|nr:Wzz/FepE/Etk N-terminal domain-containing protein [Granulicella arctica]